VSSPSKTFFTSFSFLVERPRTAAGAETPMTYDLATELHTTAGPRPLQAVVRSGRLFEACQVYELLDDRPKVSLNFIYVFPVCNKPTTIG
jgi:hypothetical protein